MGLVLLLLGAGSIVAMPLAANLSGRFSSKPIVLLGGVGLAVILPLLSIVSSPIALGVALFAFGACTLFKRTEASWLQPPLRPAYKAPDSVGMTTSFFPGSLTFKLFSLRIRVNGTFKVKSARALFEIPFRTSKHLDLFQSKEAFLDRGYNVVATHNCR
jgi:hypothetical protein